MTVTTMRRRLSAGIAGAFVAATALVATTAGTAQAAPTACTTTVTLKASYKTNEFKGYNSLNASTSSSCTSPYVGTTRIQKLVSGTWVDVAMNSSGASYASFYGAGKFNATTTYRAVYSGGENTSYQWAPSTSSNLRVAVLRLVKVNDRSTRRASVGQFAIKPAKSIARKVALFQVRKGGAWRAYKRVRVPNNGVMKVTFANSRAGIKYRMVLPAGGGFVKSVHGPFTATRR